VLQEEKFETEATVTVATAVVINIAMTTSSEPYIGWVAYYGEPINPVSNGVGVTIIAPGTVRWPRVYYSVIGWGAWVVGCSVVGGFTAVPSTTVTGQTPDTVTITFSLGVVAILNASSATVNAVIISPTYGVFQPNMGSLYSPYPFLAGGRPTACVSMRWYTNAYGTMIVLLNPLFDVQGISDSAAACSAALRSGTTISLILPIDAMQPNIAAGQWVYFTIRMVDPYMDNSLKLFTLYPTAGFIGPRPCSVDSAALMLQPGWFTTTACAGGIGLGYTPGLLTDFCAMTVEDRCLLVCAIASISPVSFGLLTCPSGTNLLRATSMVTFIKYPEAALIGYNWPWSYASNVQWPVLVSMPNTVAIAITNFGWIIDVPMFAIVVSYPAVDNSLRALGVNPAVPITWTLLLVIRMDRFTQSCMKLNGNPWGIELTTTNYIVQCLFFPSCVSNIIGIPLEYLTWGTRHFYVPADGAVVCWSTVSVSPTPTDDGSDNALFGLLALIAAPILLCYCLLGLLWFLRPKREPPCCVPENPVQEMYWVAADAAPVYMVDNAAPAYSTAANPMYIVQ